MRVKIPFDPHNHVFMREVNMYTADEKRYDTMRYNRCGRSGLKLPVVSLGLWHNFGDFHHTTT